MPSGSKKHTTYNTQMNTYYYIKTIPIKTTHIIQITNFCKEDKRFLTFDSFQGDWEGGGRP